MNHIKMSMELLEIPNARKNLSYNLNNTKIDKR